jgi:hypothetical protein
MACEPQIERLIHTPVHVRERNLNVVEGIALGHGVAGF